MIHDARRRLGDTSEDTVTVEGTRFTFADDVGFGFGTNPYRIARPSTIPVGSSATVVNGVFTLYQTPGIAPPYTPPAYVNPAYLAPYVPAYVPPPYVPPYVAPASNLPPAVAAAAAVKGAPGTPTKYATAPASFNVALGPVKDDSSRPVVSRYAPRSYAAPQQQQQRTEGSSAAGRTASTPLAAWFRRLFAPAPEPEPAAQPAVSPGLLAGLGAYPSDSYYDPGRPTWLPNWIDSPTESAQKIGAYPGASVNTVYAPPSAGPAPAAPQTRDAMTNWNPTDMATRNAATWSSWAKGAIPDAPKTAEGIGAIWLYAGIGLGAFILIRGMKK